MKTTKIRQHSPIEKIETVKKCGHRRLRNENRRMRRTAGHYRKRDGHCEIESVVEKMKPAIEKAKPVIPKARRRMQIFFDDCELNSPIADAKRPNSKNFGSIDPSFDQLIRALGSVEKFAPSNR
jgi:hypothetical protein